MPRISFFDCCIAACLLLRFLCFQNGPQQAQGVVGYQQFPFLTQFDTNAAATIVTFCDAALHFAQTHVEVHKLTRVITDCVSPAACLGLNIYCRERGIPTLCSYPDDMSFEFDDAHPEIWKAVQDFEIKFVKDLRSAVSVEGDDSDSACSRLLSCSGMLPGWRSSSPRSVLTLQQGSRIRQCVQH